MMPGQEANSENLVYCFRFLHNNCNLNILIRMASGPLESPP